MNFKTDKPIVFFDLETTGTDVAQDKIVQLAALKISPAGELMGEPKKMLINPLRPIPAGATAVHGITDEMVKDEAPFAQRAKAIAAYFAGCDIGGYNIKRFDLPLLIEEFLRLQIDFPEPATRIFDAMQIFHLKEPRDLAGAVRFYLDREIEGAHDALNDTMATWEVFKTQTFCYQDLADMTPDELHTYCQNLKEGERALDMAGRLIVDGDGVPRYNFGKHKGTRVIEEPGFGEWMLQQNFITLQTKNIVRALLKK